jgi:hypothetical protein
LPPSPPSPLETPCFTPSSTSAARGQFDSVIAWTPKSSVTHLGRTPLVDVSALDVPQFEQDAYELEVDCV